MSEAPVGETHSAIVALIGRSNVGKSTLMNRLLGEKVSIVTPIVQTTRTIVRGVLTEPRGQLVFIDTPGLHQTRHDLGRLMNRVARRTAEDADLALFVVDASHAPRAEDEGWAKRLARASTPVLGALNQVDRGARFASRYRALCEGRDLEWHEVSAATGQGTDRLLEALFRRAHPGPLLFPPDVLTDYPRKLAIADIVREKLFMQLHAELPQDVAVAVEALEEGEDGWNTEVVVHVNKPTQKPIVIGNKGRLLRKVKRQSEAELRAAFSVPVHVHLWVKVSPKWARNFWFLKQVGYAE